MFTKTGVKNAVNTVKDIRHDLLLNFSEDYLFEGTDRTDEQVYVELPHPIHEPFKITEKDPVKQLLEEKEEYFKLVEVKRRRYNFDKKNIYKEKIAGSEYLYLPKHLLEFYKEKDPDSYFNCDYNFYYTGGFLEHIQISNEDYLIRPDAENKLCLSNLQLSSNVTLKYDIPTRIFNIRAVKNDDRYLLLLRGKHNLNIAAVSNTEKLSDVWTHKHQVPIVDARLNHEQVGIVGANFKLSIRNIETGQTLISYKNESNFKSDNFQQLQFLNTNTVVLSDRFQVKFIDCRTKTIEQVFNPELLECNALCNFEIRGNDFYLTSRHYLIKSDLRKLENVSCFSHSLSTPPCYMSFGTKSEDTFLCLAGQIPNNKILFSGKSVFGLPYKVPGIRSTLKECLLNSPSMFLRDDLSDRLDFSVAGLKLLNLNSEIYIFWANSLGEIFQQKISDVEPDTETPIKTLTNWVNSLKKIKPLLHLTCVEEMSSARFSLHTNPIESNLTKYKKNNTGQKFMQKFGPIYSKKNVTSKLAQDFLALWDDGDDEAETETLPEVPVHDKVNSWIQTHDFSDDENSFSFLNVSKSQE